jgi:hypothetical protein
MTSPVAVRSDVVKHSHIHCQLNRRAAEFLNAFGVSDRTAYRRLHGHSGHALLDGKPTASNGDWLSQDSSRGDGTSIELFSGSFCNWTKTLISIAQALGA